jgi:hypothetical protein
MKLEYRLMLGVSAFLVAAFVVYLLWSKEATGSVLLLFGGCAYGLIFCFFLLQVVKRKHIPRPEDNPEATYADGAGPVDFFPSASIWPAGMGLGAIFMGVAFIYGSWFYLIGGTLLIGAIIGFCVEAEARD